MNNRISRPLENVKYITLPKITDSRGSLSFVEANNHIPFDIKRVYYLYNVPSSAERGGHAHINLHQLIIASSGSFDLVLDDGFEKKTFKLSDPSIALYICPMIWRDIVNFRPGSVCLVLASMPYDENDYIREYAQFIQPNHV